MQNVHAAFACPNTLIVEIAGSRAAAYRAVGRLPPAGGRPGPATRRPGLGVELTDARGRIPLPAGAEEFSSVPGKVMRS